MQILRSWLADIGDKTSTLVYGRTAALTGILLFLGTTYSSGQNQNYCNNPGALAKGEFTIDKEKICVGTPVKITGKPSYVGNDGYDFRYNGNGLPTSLVPGTPLPSFTYTQPGSYTIIQIGSSGSGSVFCRTVTVLPLDPVKFTVKACSGRTATLVFDQTTLGQYDTYILNWGDGNVLAGNRTTLLAQTTHTYNNNGPYTISITGRYEAPAGCDGERSSQVAQFATTSQPTISKLTSLNDNSISIQYQVSSGSSAELYRKDASGNYVPTGQIGNGSAPFTVQADTKQVQCFQVVAQDACSTAGFRSDEVCSLVLDAKAVSKQNDLSWQAYAGTVSAAKPFRYYRILRNGNPVGGALTNRTATTYSDNNNIQCGLAYCYSLEATIGPTTVTSAPACATGINGEAPGSLSNVFVSIENNRPRLVVGLPSVGASASYTLAISRSTGTSGNFQPVGTSVNRNTFVDESANPDAGSYCYQITYQNNCKLSSPPSQPVCTVFLGASTSGISWTTESPFSTGDAAGYTVEVIDSVNGTKEYVEVQKKNNFEPDPNDPNLQSQKYRIIAVSSSGVPSYSNFFTFRREARILVPDAFTPNGDNTNETFIAKGIYVDQFTMTIYNRWGSVIYSTTDKAKGWDGTAEGQPSPPGQYMYRIEVVDLTGQKTVRTGALLLIR
ncbi:gliding motility-associated C-terminal domain-containing protein [Spirosoma soli]|uniref:Gliding motility-associated C-terminal domain-containing protein n=1 Tax=Spirosoma soli TaxID=1770529 RepID=A0ABW5LYP2_9BACT